MNRYIKTVEHDIKNINRCYGYLKIINSIKEMQGYYSYIEKFRNLFDIKVDEKDSKVLDAKNVLTSLSSTVEKQLLKFNHKKDTIAIILTFFMLIISTNILINVFYDIDFINSSINRVNVFIATASPIIFFYFKSFKCMILTLMFYNFYDSYEYMFHLKNLKEKNRTQKVFNFIINNMGFILTIVTGIYFLIIYVFTR